MASESVGNYEPLSVDQGKTCQGKRAVLGGESLSVDRRVHGKHDVFISLAVGYEKADSVAAMYSPAGRVIARGSLPTGRAGTRRTLALMRALAIQGSKMIDVREAAIGALKTARVAPRDYVGEIRAVHQFVRDRIRYTRDIVGVETLHTPSYTLRAGVGDCDDKSTLLAAMLRGIGHPAELGFRAIGTDPGRPNHFGHVYVVAFLGGRRIPLDPTNQLEGPGWEFRPATVAMGVPV